MTKTSSSPNAPSGIDMAGRLAAVLASHGVTVGFGVPGGGANLDVVGAMEASGIRFVLAHGETAACIMASTHGLLTSTPVPAVVTRGPGAACAVNGAAQATLDRQPLLLISDTVPTGTRDRVPHQRVDQISMLAPVTKDSLPFGPSTEYDTVSDLVALAVTEPPGAVHLDYDIGLDSQTERGTQFGGGPEQGNGASAGNAGASIEPLATETVAIESEIEAVASRIELARRPVVLIGRGALGPSDAVAAAALRFGAPVFMTYQAAGVIPTEHDLAAGLFTNGASEEALIEEADLIVTIGLDSVEPRSAPWPYQQPVVAFSPVPASDPYHPIEAELVGDLGVLSERTLRPGHDWPSDAGARFRQSVRAELRRGEPDSLGPVALVETMVGQLPPNVTTTVDAGAHFLAIMPFWPAAAPNRVLISNGLATMGYALPAAIGASLARTGEPVLCLVGDGGLGMTLAELETVARLDLPITTVVFNDSGLSLIEIKQRAGDHGGSGAVRYRTIDFSAVARGLGMEATVATTVDDVTQAMRSGWSRPRLIDARIDPSHYRHLIAVTRG